QRAKMVDIDVQKQYSKRGQTVELGFADAKTHRGFQRFHGRGLDRVRSETGLLFLSQNLLRLERLMLNARKSENIHT
ncbi:MAG: transposase, partial [Planctomycetaceae bacterium]